MGYFQKRLSLCSLLGLLCCWEGIAFDTGGFLPVAPKKELFLAGSRFSADDTPMTNSRLRETRLSAVTLSSELELGSWISAFATSHIAMSASRRVLIRKAGDILNGLGLVGNEGWLLPSFWPGDTVGQNRVFPDVETAGRQFYRAGYTFVSFLTLGSAFACYLSSLSYNTSTLTEEHPWAFAIAVAANTAALTSLFNASPLGLMPSFQSTNDDAPIQRDDSLKLEVRGLTRITRHPLILPVVPWAIANAVLMGGKTMDWLFFGGLAVYAIAGCAAQDLRVMRQEGSVGTVFSDQEQAEALQVFFASTSLVPFRAVMDGRQSLAATVAEIPWLAIVPASLVGYQIEVATLQFLGSGSG